MIERRVGGDDSGDFIFLAGRDDFIELVGRKVGRNFYQNRFARNPVFIADGTQQLRERGASLQLAQTRSVGRADV